MNDFETIQDLLDFHAFVCAKKELDGDARDKSLLTLLAKRVKPNRRNEMLKELVAESDA